jgi:hypothetical protein
MTPTLLPTISEAIAYYGQRELLFQHRMTGHWALADNRDGILIDALTAAGCWLAGAGSKALEIERELAD